MSPVPVPQRGDPAFYSQERRVPQPMQPTPGGQPGSPAPARPLQPLVGYSIQQGAGSLTADLPSAQQQADSLKASASAVCCDDPFCVPSFIDKSRCSTAVLTHHLLIALSTCFVVAGVAAQRVVSSGAGDAAERRGGRIDGTAPGGVGLRSVARIDRCCSLESGTHPRSGAAPLVWSHAAQHSLTVHVAAYCKPMRFLKPADVRKSAENLTHRRSADVGMIAHAHCTWHDTMTWVVPCRRPGEHGGNGSRLWNVIAQVRC